MNTALISAQTRQYTSTAYAVFSSDEVAIFPTSQTIASGIAIVRGNPNQPIAGIFQAPEEKNFVLYVEYTSFHPLLDDLGSRRNIWQRLFGDQPMPDPTEHAVEDSQGLLDRALVKPLEEERLEEILEGKDDY